jgi:hypothetical protein
MTLPHLDNSFILAGSLLDKTTVSIVSGSSRRHTPSYYSELIAILVAVINIGIIAPWQLDS